MRNDTENQSYCSPAVSSNLDVHAYLERGRVWDTDREVGKDSESLVSSDAPEREVVRDFVDGEEEIVVRGSANHVCSEEEYGRQGVGVPEQAGKTDLQ